MNKYLKITKKSIVEKLQLQQKTNYPKVLVLHGGNTITLNKKKDSCFIFRDPTEFVFITSIRNLNYLILPNEYFFHEVKIYIVNVSNVACTIFGGN